VVAKERMFAWVPAWKTPPPSGYLNHPAIQSIRQAAARSSLKDPGAVGATLGKYQVFCDQLNIPNAERFPASYELLHTFALWAAAPMTLLENMVEKDPAKDVQFDPVLVPTVRKYLSDIRAWHLAHGLHPPLSDADWERISFDLRGLERLQADGDKEAPRPPVLVQHLRALAQVVDRKSAFEVAAWAWTLIAFFAAARSCEGTVERRRDYKPTEFPSFGSVVRGVDFAGLPSWEIPIPKPKTLATLKDQAMVFTQQAPIVDPIAAFEAHERLNYPAPSDHVFAWRDPKTKEAHPLTKSSWITVVRKWYAMAGIRYYVVGHSFRIGGASYWLAIGTPPDIVRWLGRWSSTSFDLYIRGFRLIAAQHLYMRA
jgi:hypothetical protein